MGQKVELYQKDSKHMIIFGDVSKMSRTRCFGKLKIIWIPEAYPE